MKSTLAGLIVVAGVAAACGGAPAKPAAPAMNVDSMRAAIVATGAKFDSILEHKDAAGLAGLYAGDATWLLPDGSQFVGHDAILAGATAFFKSFDSVRTQPMQINAFFPVDSTDVVVFAQVPYTLYEKGKKPSSHINYFATHFVKSNGTWLAHHDYNIDATVKDSTTAKKP